MNKLANFVNNEFLQTDNLLDSYDPAVGNVWAQVPDSDAADVDKAVLAAKNAFPM